MSDSDDAPKSPTAEPTNELPSMPPSRDVQTPAQAPGGDEDSRSSKKASTNGTWFVVEEAKC